MSNYKDNFKNDRYVYVENLLTEKECDEAISVLKDTHEKGMSSFDEQCGRSICFDTNPLLYLHENKKSLFEEILGLKLIPTYSYCRIYKPGEVLEKHIDRYACEVSITVNLGYIGNIWPIYFLNKNESAENIYYYLEQSFHTGISKGNLAFSPYINTSNKIKFDIDKGSGVFYRGCELVHWREKYVEGEEQAQVFFHYVNANGPYRDLSMRKNIYTAQDFYINAGIV